VRNKITSTTIRIMGIAGNSEIPISPTLQTRSSKFLQTLIYFILWLQRQIHMKHRCKYMSHLRSLPISFFSIVLSLFLAFLSDASVGLQVNISGIYINKFSSGLSWSYRLNSLDNTYLPTIRFISLLLRECALV